MPADSFASVIRAPRSGAQWLACWAHKLWFSITFEYGLAGVIRCIEEEVRCRFDGRQLGGQLAKESGPSAEAATRYAEQVRRLLLIS